MVIVGGLSKYFNTSIQYWLSQEVEELFEWLEVAESIEKNNRNKE